MRERGLRLVVTSTEASSLAEGKIVSQSPLPGSTLRSGEAVEVVLSSGVAMVGVPDLNGRPLAAARTLLEEAGFVVEADETGTGGPPGTVVSTSPEAGAELEAMWALDATLEQTELTIQVLLPLPSGASAPPYTK